MLQESSIKPHVVVIWASLKKITPLNDEVFIYILLLKVK